MKFEIPQVAPNWQVHEIDMTLDSGWGGGKFDRSEGNRLEVGRFHGVLSRDRTEGGAHTVWEGSLNLLMLEMKGG